MREVRFVQRNADRWKQLEADLDDESADADRLADLYIEVTDDLAYARTFYPDSETTEYLNGLAARVHEQLYRYRPGDRGGFLRFWTKDVPEAMAGARTELLIAGLLFVVAIAIGALSAMRDAGFVRLILGDAYVNRTLEYIRQGDPMAVYKQAHAMDMFMGIALNNIRVSFVAFAAGVFGAVGTGFVLFQNGVMLGAFHTLFYQQGLLGQSLLVVYIHGTLEISAIIIAGAAGFCLGRGLLFPGTHTRRRAFMQGAKQGATIIVGLVPVFLAAALLEGFVTRYTAMPVALSLTIIGGSLVAVVGYFLVLPAFVGTASSRA